MDNYENSGDNEKGTVGSSDVDNRAQLQLMTDLVKTTQRSEKTEETIAYATKEIAKYTKKMDIIIMGIIISLIIFFGVKLLMIFLQNRRMVIGIDKAGASKWPSSGLGTAIAYAIPASAGILGFQNRFLPVAAWMCFEYYDTNPYWKANTGSCLNLMAQQSMYGAAGVPGESLSAMSLICGPQSWGVSCTTLSDCSGRCPNSSSPSVPNLVAGGITGAQTGAFIGHGFGGGVGMGVGALAMAGIQIGQEYLSHGEADKAIRDANNCN